MAKINGIGVCYFCGIRITKENNNRKGYADCCSNKECIRKEESYFQGCYK